jgi:hypothetical protein
MATPNKKELEQLGIELFGCLLNRIYNVSDFERLGDVTEKERKIIDRWLSRSEGEPDDRPIF